MKNPNLKGTALCALWFLTISLCCFEIEAQPVLQLRLPFTDAPGSTTTPSDTVLGTINVTMDMTIDGTTPRDLHGALGMAPDNKSRCLDMTTNTVPAQDDTQPGNMQHPSAAVYTESNPALAALGQSGTIGSFVFTFWMYSALGFATGNGARMFILNPGDLSENTYNRAGAFTIRWYSDATIPNNEWALWFGGGSDLIWSMPFDVPTNQWLFVAMAWDGQNDPTAYWGTQTNSATLMSLVSGSGSLAPGSTLPMGDTPTLVIGNQGSNWSRSLNGKLFDVRFYNGGTTNLSFIEGVRLAGAPPLALPPSPLSFSYANSKLSLSWSNGLGILLSGTNVTQPMSQWVPVVTNPPMPYVITISPSPPQTFFRAK
jgi:hypothetical protein